MVSPSICSLASAPEVRCLKNRPTKKSQGPVGALLEHHELVEIKVGRDIGANLDPYLGFILGVATKTGLLLNRGDLHCEGLDGQDAPN